MRLLAVFFITAFVKIVDLGEVPPGAEPIQLLDFGSSDEKIVTVTNGSIERLFLNPTVAQRNVVVVSIAGALRKGKSFLLNYMLRYMYANYKSVALPDKVINETEAQNWLGDSNEPLKGFSWKSSSKRDTTGIIFWSDVFLYDAPNGDKTAIYLMDTQGLFDHSSTPTDNVRIFSLSALMSSLQLMNIFGVVEESHLEYLQFATEIARFTAVESNTGMKPFQRLMFIIRDWSSPDEYGYGLEGGKTFIQRYLTVKSFHTPELRAVRQHLKSTFESISGFLMPYPGKMATRNSSFDGRWSDIDEEFVETLKQLAPAILAPANLTLKKVNGIPIKAFELGVYVKQYVDLFKSDNLPEAKSIYESTLDNQFQILMSSSVELYLQSVALYQNRIKNADEILVLHNVSKSLALKYFNEEKKFGNEEESLVYYEELDGKLKKAYGDWAPAAKDSMVKLATEQAKTSVQKNLANEAENRQKAAKSQTESADQKYLELQRQIATMKTDNADSRREAERVRTLLDHANKERQQAIAFELEARKHFQGMQLKLQKLENQLQAERHHATQMLNKKFDQVRQRDGFSGMLSGIAVLFKSFGAFIENAFRSIF